MNRRVLVIAAVGTVALVMLWYLALWRPQGTRLDEAEQRREAAEQENSELEVTLARLEDLEERRPELEDDLAQLRKAVPGSPALASFFLAADDAAERAGVELNTITPSKPTAADAANATTATTAATTASGSTDTTAAGTTPTTAAATTTATPIGLSLDVAGGYFQVLDFVNRLNAMPRIVVVDSLSLSASSSGEETAGEATAATSSGDLTTTITARMFTTDGNTGSTADAGATGGTTDAGSTTATTASSEAPR